MVGIDVERDHLGRLVVTARSQYGEGRVVLVDDGQFVLDGDFAEHFLPTAVLDLLVDALSEARRHAVFPQIAANATLLARCATDDSVDPDDEDEQDWGPVDGGSGRFGSAALPPRQVADIVVTVEGGDGLPIAIYTCHTNPFSPIGADPLEVLSQRGWRVVADRGRDRWNYHVVVVERSDPDAGN